MSVSQVFILSARGDKIVFKDYRQDVPRNADEVFFRKVKFWDGAMHQAPLGDCPPFFIEKGITFAFARRSGLLIVASSLDPQASPSFLGELLVRFCKVLKDFLGVLSEEAIRKNFVLVYELLDEIIDVGTIQELASERLRPYIFNEPIPVEDVAVAAPAPSDSLVSRLRRGEFLAPATRRATATNQSIITSSKERKNEIYIDIIERLNVVFNSAGTIVTSEVDGSIVMKSFLAGTPDLIVGFNDDLVVGRDGGRAKYATVCLDSVNFHETADYSKFETDRTLVMRPPDGEFVLMNYRMTGNFTPPFRVVSSIELVSNYKAELTLRVRSDIPSTTAGINMMIRCPVPKTTTSVTVELGIGSSGQTYEYRQEEKVVCWALPRFNGGTEQVCKICMSTSAPFTAASRKELGPVSMVFEVPMHNVTGLTIKFLRLEERSQTYNPQRWVRNITQGGSYVARIS